MRQLRGRSAGLAAALALGTLLLAGCGGHKSNNSPASVTQTNAPASQPSSSSSSSSGGGGYGY